jgi:N6-adenosine-specific RNA methylase IME4
MKLPPKLHRLNAKRKHMVSFPRLPDLPDGQYKTVMADPPWAYDDDLPGPGRGSSSHYDTLHFGTVMGMGPQIRKVTAPQAHLYLWTTNSFMQEALQVANAWGFDQKSIITWVKVQDEPQGLPNERDHPVSVYERLGMGNYLRNTTEHILFCVKGRMGVDLNTAPTHFFAERTEHSAKPAKSYKLAEALSPEPRIDLFSRTSRSGWDVWGKETPDDASLADFPAE